MRVTSNTFPNSLLDEINRLSVRQNRLQQQAATGQRLTVPEDDPVGMRRVLDLQNDASSVDQYLRNVERSQEVATASFGPMKSLNKVVGRAEEIATLANGIKSREELDAYAAEVNELIQQGVQLMNTQNRGDYIFGGTVADRPPFAVSVDADGLVSGVTYQGNTDLAAHEVGSGVTLSAQTIGSNSTGSGPRGLVTDSRTGADLFAHLIALRDSLKAGDTDAISGTVRDGLKADEDNLITHLGMNGAVQSRLETASTIMKQRAESDEAVISREVDVDLSETIVQLTQLQTAYQAALQSGGTIINQSLLDYIR